MEFDLAIVGGRILDGTGNPWFKADIGIKDGKISFIGKMRKPDAAEVINVENLIVCPGFIDIHSHSDFTVLVDPKAESKVMQGVTLEVVGNCGSSAAPMNDFLREYREKYLKPSLGEGIEFDWETMDQYFRKLEERGISVNIASYVGHGTVRSCVLGFSDRQPTKSELEEMKELVARAMEDGAVGLSTGLIYTPGCYAKTDEIIELAKVASEYGGIYASHIRGEGATLIEAVKEAITIGEKASIPVEISHFKASGKPNWGKVKEAIKIILEAREKGVDVTADQYPYTASSTSLTALLPKWAREGGAEKILERLRDAEIRSKIIEEMKSYTLQDKEYWNRIMICQVERNKQFEGMRVAEIAKLLDKDPINTVLDLILEEETIVRMINFGISEEDVETIMRLPWVMVGSDGRAVSPTGKLGEGKPHPRYYGTFPRVIGRYAREKRIIPIEMAVRKMTYLPAWRLGLRDRGIIREEAWADIVVFNSNEIIDQATFTNPHQFPKGIEYVIVNGKVTVKRGTHTGILNGRVLRLRGRVR